jgi:cyclase
LSDRFGAQSIVVAIDVRRDWLKRPQVVTYAGTKRAPFTPQEWARRVEALGAGEILLNSVDRDGTFQGYDVALVRDIAHAVNVPVVACGGAGKVEDCARVVKEAGASAAAAGSIFVFQGIHRAVLISFPSEAVLSALFEEK